MSARQQSGNRAQKPGLRIGIFGGSFDPPHRGHLLIAGIAQRQLRLHRVLFVPAYLPPHKKHGTSASAAARLAMVRLAVQKNPRFAVSDLEIRRRGISYTAVTLRSLRKRFPRAEFFLLVGSDNARQFHTWKSSSQIARHTTLAVYKRGRWGRVAAGKMTNVVKLNGPSLSISSSRIREMIRGNREVRGLLPPAVHRFVRSRQLYR